MIPRYQRILYWVLVGGIFLMSLLLLRGCIRNKERVAAMRDQSPIPAPANFVAENFQVAVGSDVDGTLTMDSVTLSMPQEPSVRARMLLEKLLADGAAPASPHTLPAGPAIADVFFVPLPIVNGGHENYGPSSSTTAFGLHPSDLPQTERNAAASDSSTSPYGYNHFPGAVLAVVSFRKAFADQHPSSVESEDLTVRSILGTLHANFAQVEQVRFLVDGQTRDTLNGHIDLTRPFPIGDPAKFEHALGADGSTE